MSFADVKTKVVGAWNNAATWLKTRVQPLLAPAEAEGEHILIDDLKGLIEDALKAIEDNKATIAAEQSAVIITALKVEAPYIPVAADTLIAAGVVKGEEKIVDVLVNEIQKRLANNGR